MSDRKYIVLILDDIGDIEAEKWAMDFKQILGTDILITTTQFVIVPFDPDGNTTVTKPPLTNTPTA